MYHYYFLSALLLTFSSYQFLLSVISSASPIWKCATHAGLAHYSLLYVTLVGNNNQYATTCNFTWKTTPELSR